MWFLFYFRFIFFAGIIFILFFLENSFSELFACSRKFALVKNLVAQGHRTNVMCACLQEQHEKSTCDI